MLKNIYQLEKKVKEIEKLDDYMKSLSDSELKQKTLYFKECLKKGEKLDNLMVEAYAVVREASDRVLGLKPYPVQLMGAIALHQGKIAEMKTGEGKANPVYTPIPTPDGWKTVGDIRVGDFLFDRHGKPTRVTGVFPQGEKEIYEVELKDGRVVECAPEHLWTVFKQYHDSEKVMTTEDLYQACVRGGRGYRWMIPVNDCVEYFPQQLDLDPYVMGAFLGNGCKNKTKVFEFSSMDENMVAEIAKILDVNFVKSHGKNYTWHFYKKYDANVSQNHRYKVENIAPQYVELLTQSYAHEKYIPMEYKIGSKEQRLALLQGLFDTDGNIYEDNEGGQKRYNIQFSTTSVQLRDDVLEILYSLGLQGAWFYGKKAGNGAAKHDQYVVRVHVNHDKKPDLFRLSRKKVVAEKAANDIPKRRDYSRIAIVDIRKTNRMAKQVCFTVDNPEHLFLIDKYVVTHNTIVAALPSYLHALDGKGVHVVTVNDYLAKRDAEMIGKIHKFLGLSVGVILNEDKTPVRKAAYACDITYITNTELGFDYLRDNMVYNTEDRVQRGLHYAIIDEVDSILIDEARTPLIISGQGNDSTRLYHACDVLAKRMMKGEGDGELSKIDALSGFDAEEDGDFMVNEKEKQIILTQEGVQKIEEYFGIKNLARQEFLNIRHNMMIALRANYLMHKDRDYVVKKGEVLIVDEFTGRIMPGRRYNDGLHQAIEAKEGVEIQKESRTVATITYQNFFNKYEKKSGMTGTAWTERKEFKDIYRLEVVPIPTNKAMIRVDLEDSVFLTKEEKYQAVVDDIINTNKTGQPVLVGTINIEVSEILSKMLKEKNIPHQTLNAKNHEMEAEIISHAGEKNAVTIATNMAGRGTDIILGKGVAELGGLKVIGTERHEARRIDDQLRGRSGRQGDPGISKFYLSLEDNLLKLFCPQNMIHLYRNLGVEYGQELKHHSLTKSIKKSQKKIENNHFGMRKNLMDYDRINNEQREIIYHDRNSILEKDGIEEIIFSMIDSIVFDTILQKTKKKQACMWDLNDIHRTLSSMIPIQPITLTEEEKKKNSPIILIKRIQEESKMLYKEKNYTVYRDSENPEETVSIREVEKIVLLNGIDQQWMAQIEHMDKLREGIYLYSYAQINPITQYRLLGNELFVKAADSLKKDTIRSLFYEY